MPSIITIITTLKNIYPKHVQLKEILNDSTQVWQTDTINWYGDETRQIEYITFVCLWYKDNKPKLLYSGGVILSV